MSENNTVVDSKLSKDSFRENKDKRVGGGFPTIARTTEHLQTSRCVTNYIMSYNENVQKTLVINDLSVQVFG